MSVRLSVLLVVTLFLANEYHGYIRSKIPIYISLSFFVTKSVMRLIKFPPLLLRGLPCSFLYVFFSELFERGFVSCIYSDHDHVSSLFCCCIF
jgi:hypothetical protein